MFSIQSTEISQPSNNQSQSNQSNNQSGNTQSNITLLEQIYSEVISITDSKKVITLDEVSLALLSGNSLFILDGEKTILVMDTVGGEKRAIQEPQSETVIRGSRIGFVENIATNIAIIRREIKDPNLRFDVHEVGRRSKQKLAVCYIAGIANQEILDEMNRRLKSIDIDFAPDSGSIEQWIEDSSLSPFPQILDTERPDRFTYNLLQGKVGILVEGSPFAIIAPITFGDALITVEDYNARYQRIYVSVDPPWKKQDLQSTSGNLNASSNQNANGNLNAQGNQNANGNQNSQGNQDSQDNQNSQNSQNAKDKQNSEGNGQSIFKKVQSKLTKDQNN
ncbi:spore germination protein [Ureibacillus sp. MALMAid1270]|uniref:spore germination protein n=1 Tax=Ureibacillus sp. MALMAid1270 TaxID=3411629 RepID=UPI003BA7E9D2